MCTLGRIFQDLALGLTIDPAPLDETAHLLREASSLDFLDFDWPEIKDGWISSGARKTFVVS